MPMDEKITELCLGYTRLSFAKYLKQFYPPWRNAIILINTLTKNNGRGRSFKTVVGKSSGQV
jgi:hypothetical protein